MKNYIKNLKGDIFGGIISSIVALPQALAFGVATGLGAKAGVLGAIILCFISGGILSTKSLLISGPTGPCSVVIASFAALYLNDINAIVTILIMAAVFQFLIGLTSLPTIVKYIPYPVISGFLNGVGVLLIFLQLNPILGFDTLSSLIKTIKHILLNLSFINFHALFLAILTLLVIFLIPKRISKYLPAQILALVLCTYISIKFNFDVKTISHVPFGLPEIIIPQIDIAKLNDYIPYALTLAVVGSCESLLTGLVSDSLSKNKSSHKKIILFQGIGNFFCAITGSLFGAAATMRTVAAINANATTCFAAIINALFLVIVLFNFSGFVSQIPLAVLGGILIKIGIDIIDVKLLKVVKFAPKDDLYVLLVVFLLTVFYNLIFAVGAGITLAALLYAKRMADKTDLKFESVYDDDIMNFEKKIETDYQHKIRVVHIQGQFFFGTATQIVSQFDEILGTKYLILNYESDALLDISAIFALEDIIIRLNNQKIKLMLIVKNDEVRKQLKDLNIVKQIGENHIFYNELDAVNLAKTCIKTKIRRQNRQDKKRI